MVKCGLVMQLLLESCQYREIHARHKVSHSTIAKARKALDDNKIITTDQLNGYSDDELDSFI